MKKIILTKDNVLIALADTVEDTENGKLVKNGQHEYYLGFEATIIDIEETAIPSYVEPFKYIYLDGSFSTNPNYVAPPKSQAELEQELAQLKTLVADLTEVVLMGV